MPDPNDRQFNPSLSDLSSMTHWPPPEPPPTPEPIQRLTAHDPGVEPKRLVPDSTMAGRRLNDIYQFLYGATQGTVKGATGLADLAGRINFTPGMTDKFGNPVDVRLNQVVPQVPGYEILKGFAYEPPGSSAQAIGDFSSNFSPGVPGMKTGATLAKILSSGKGLAIAGGPLSKMADRHRLRWAIENERQGRSNRAIWNRTGWERGHEGAWKYEISDALAKLKGFENNNIWGEHPYYENTLRLDQALEHPELFRAYPDLRNIRLEFYGNPQTKSFGEYQEPYSWGNTHWPEAIKLYRQDGRTTDDYLRTILHELDHAVGRREGHTPGMLYAGDYEKYIAQGGEAQAHNTQRRHERKEWGKSPLYWTEHPKPQNQNPPGPWRAKDHGWYHTDEGWIADVIRQILRR